MTARTSAKLGIKRTSSGEPTIKSARDLRYDNLSSVLLKIDEQTHGTGTKRDGLRSSLRHNSRSYALRSCR